MILASMCLFMNGLTLSSSKMLEYLEENHDNAKSYAGNQIRSIIKI